MEHQLGVVVILEQGGRVLLGQRLGGYKAGFFGLPGGRVEQGEPLAVAAHRELTEETGCVAEQLVYQGFVKEDQGRYDFVHFVFRCVKWQNKPMCKEPEKCAGWEWYSTDALPQPLLPGHEAALSLEPPFVEI